MKYPTNFGTTRRRSGCSGNITGPALLGLRAARLLAHRFDRAHVRLELAQVRRQPGQSLVRLRARLETAEEHAQARRLRGPRGHEEELGGIDLPPRFGEVCLEILAAARIRDHELDG